MSRRPFLALLLLFFFGLALADAGSAAAQSSEISGYVTHVRDGDTIEVANRPVRFSGVSAPELSEPYGQQSKRAMQGLVAGKQLRCELTGKKSYDRWVGTCFLPDGRDLSAAIVALGLARDCPRYSKGRYARYETDRSRRLSFPGYCRRR